MKCENCIHYGVCVVNSYCHEPCGYYEEDRPRGEWKEFTVSTYRGTDEWGEPKWGKGKKFICKRCGRRTVIRENFCPNCGADMRQKEGEANENHN